MARRRIADKRPILPDPKFGSQLVSKFVNYLMLKGKKSVAEKVLYGALSLLSQRVDAKNQSFLKWLSALGMLEVEMADQDGESGSDGVHNLASVNDEVNPVIILDFILDNIKPTVEVRSRRVGESTYQIPVEVRASRRTALAVRWLIEAAKKRSEKTMLLRLAAEMVEAFDNKGGAVKKRDDTHKMAKANQAFVHFRWS